MHPLSAKPAKSRFSDLLVNWNCFWIIAGDAMALEIDCLENRRRLPVIRVRRAA
jgi:hypothetical protein